jgi:hypothetical protein
MAELFQHSRVPQRQRHRFAGMEFTRKLRRIFFIILALICLQIGSQLVYPGSHTRPFISLLGSRLGYASKDTVTKRIESIENQKITVATEGKKYDTTLKDLGVSVDKSASVPKILSYSFTQRLVPLTLFKTKSEPLVVTFDDPTLQSFAAKVISEDTKAAKNATVTKSGQEYTVTQSEEGYSYNRDAIVSALKQFAAQPTKELKLKADSIAPQFTTDEYNHVIAAIKTLGSTDFTVDAEGVTHTISGSSLKGWVKGIAAQSDSGNVSLDIDEDALYAELQKFDDELQAKQPSDTTALPIGAAVSEVNAALNDSKSSLSLKREAITYGTVNGKSYPKTSRGLQSLVEDWITNHGGDRYSVIVKEMSNQRRTARVNADDSYFTASMYKPFVVKLAYDKITKGEIDPSTTLWGSWSYTKCLEETIIHSDSPCPETFMSRFGQPTLTAQLEKEGYTHTSLVGFNTTASDSALLFERLYKGEILTADQRNELLGYMKRQEYRTGIPAGVPGVEVADKVGFYDNGTSWHDGGIVYHPKGAYILVIFTEGAGSAKLADLSKTIAKFMEL